MKRCTSSIYPTTKAFPTSRLPQPENECCLFWMFDKLIKWRTPSPEHIANWWLMGLHITCLLTCMWHGYCTFDLDNRNQNLILIIFRLKMRKSHETLMLFLINKATLNFHWLNCMFLLSQTKIYPLSFGDLVGFTNSYDHEWEEFLLLLSFCKRIRRIRHRSTDLILSHIRLFNFCVNSE